MTVRSSAGTSVAADADGAADAPVDAASGGLLEDGALLDCIISQSQTLFAATAARM